MIRGRRYSREGFTLVEVLMAIAVLTAGALAIFAMQTAATHGNYQARQMTTGTQLAQRWVERLRRDALQWTSSSSVHNPLDLANTTYLSNVPTPGDAPVWFVPVPEVGSGEAANFDFYADDTTVATEMRFCSNIRLEWLYPGRAMRADVRVWWQRQRSGTEIDSGDGTDLSACATGVDPETLTGNFRAQFAYASTVLRYATAAR